MNSVYAFFNLATKRFLSCAVKYLDCAVVFFSYGCTMGRRFRRAFMSRKQAAMVGQLLENGPFTSNVTPKSTSCPLLSTVVHFAECLVSAR